MDYEVKLESERILYIKPTVIYAKDCMKMVNDENVQKCISHNPMSATYESEVKWIESKIESNAELFFMIEKGTNEYIGSIEIKDIFNNIGELGISITPKKQDMHYGQEAIKRIIDYVFNDLKLDELELNVFDFNKRAIHTYEKCGFVMDGPGKEKGDHHMSIKK